MLFLVSVIPKYSNSLLSISVQKSITVIRKLCHEVTSTVVTFIYLTVNTVSRPDSAFPLVAPAPLPRLTRVHILVERADSSGDNSGTIDADIRDPDAWSM